MLIEMRYIDIAAKADEFSRRLLDCQFYFDNNIYSYEVYARSKIVYKDLCNMFSFMCRKNPVDNGYKSNNVDSKGTPVNIEDLNKRLADSEENCKSLNDELKKAKDYIHQREIAYISLEEENTKLVKNHNQYLDSVNRGKEELDSIKSELIKSRSESDRMKHAAKRYALEVKKYKEGISKHRQFQENCSIIVHEQPDKWIPGRIATICTRLFHENYVNANHYLKHHGRMNTEERWGVLTDIFKGAIKSTRRTIEEAKKECKEGISDVFTNKYFKKTGDDYIPKQMEHEICRRLREYVNEEQNTYLAQEIMRPFAALRSSEQILTLYTNGCVRIAWLMNACEPKMYADFNDGIYTFEKHDLHGNCVAKEGARIDQVIWPCIYFSYEAYENDEDALAKGIVSTDY